ncbi:serine hydrolase domain-containing protein [Aestuariimicrobium soli]|uniref:serine hydrolase domain-containing protein n=1 Tax=Aestuariimicrobium soli TaxID=2035834 RepID=UPI003EBB907C
MGELVPDLEGFVGVLSVRRGEDVIAEWAVGEADRTAGVPNTLATRFGLASGTKTFTALTVLSLVSEGRLRLDTRARELLADDLPLVADDVTVDHLLTHTSGIGDYLDEDVDALAPMPVPVQELDSTPAYLRVLDGHPTKFAAGTAFSYSNGGFVVLALLAERAAGTPFEQLVDVRVFRPAGMAWSGFFRTDRLPPGTATGYLDDGRTNVFQLPVLGSGDGGAYSTVADLHALWLALTGGRLLDAHHTALATEIVSHPEGENDYGRGVWHADGDLILSGGDHGVGAVSRHDPRTSTTVTGLANAGVPMIDRVAGLMNQLR